MSCLTRLRPFWIFAACCLAPWFTPDAAGATIAARAPSAAAQGRKKRRKRGKSDVHTSTRAPATAHRREHRGPAKVAIAKKPVPGRLVASPGPAQTPEARRAMDGVRHLQIERAESAARREDLTNRWETVSFLISGVDEQRYPEAAFWKVLACYRRGHISEGDSTRQRCRLSATDARTLDAERAVAETLVTQTGGTLALRSTALVSLTPERPEGVVNNAPYAGPGPIADGASASAP